MKSLPTTSQFPYGIIAAVGALLFLVFGVIIAATAYAAPEAPADGERLITIHDNGRDRGILTKADTLRQAFKEANIHTDNNDRVEPGLDEPLVASNYEVNVYRARPITIVDGHVQTKVMSAYRTPKQVVEHAGMVLQDEDETTMELATDMVQHGAGVRLVIDRATPFTFVLYGKKTAAYTQAGSIGEMLKEKEITLGEKDQLSLPEDTPITAGMTVKLWRNGKQTITVEEKVDFKVEKIQDANREPGYREVKTEGVKGERTVTYEIVMKDGKEIKRKEIQSVVTKKPVGQVEIVGAKFVYTGGPLSDKQINALGQCESGMTATRNSGNGFYGAFQFMPSTWHSVAPAPYNAGLPHEAPLDAQKQAVQNLLSGSNIFNQFPGCAKKMRAQGII